MKRKEKSDSALTEEGLLMEAASPKAPTTPLSTGHAPQIEPRGARKGRLTVEFNLKINRTTTC